MGTRFEAFLHGLPEARLRGAGEDALAEIRSLHSRLSAFEPRSVVSILNARAADSPVILAGDIFSLLSLCRDIHTASGGCFDPTIGPLMQAWGFRAPVIHAPSAEALAAAHARVGMHHVELDEPTSTARFRAPGVLLDLGSIAKGFALDAAERVLRSAGVSGAFLHGGTSSILAIGSTPEGSPWRVRLASLSGDDAGEIMDVLLRDASLSVSAPHGREIRIGDESLGHVLDPRSGRPARAARIAVVVGPGGAAADGWSTALLVAGEVPRSLPPAYGGAVLTAGSSWAIRDAQPGAVAAIARFVRVKPPTPPTLPPGMA